MIMGIRQHLRTQPHLLAHLDSLKNSQQRDELAEHLLKFDFDHLTEAFKQAQDPHLPKPEDIQPIGSSQCVDREKLNSQELDRLFTIGLKAVSEGKVAALVLAGGQASRLGSDRPKGAIPLGTGLGSRADSLLFIQAAQIARLQRMAAERFPNSKSNPVIHWLVMTSQSTDATTREHLKEVVQETGLSMDQVLVFVQNEIPAFDLEGEAFMADHTRLVTSPNGHGGLYDAIAPLVPLLENRGVEYIHCYCVDNILCRVPDLHMIGCAIERKVDCATKVIEKKDPTELLGHVCLERGKVRVLEYSEISRELAERRDPADPSKLMLRAGSIANHFFTLQFVREACQHAQRMPYHIARKKIAHFCPERGQFVQPEQPNGIKLERFMFDAFCYSKNFMVWQVPTVEEFSPLKNHESVGRDCLSTCLRDFHGPNGKWIREACVACCQQQQQNAKQSDEVKQSDEGKQYNKQKENGQPRMNKL